MLKIKMDTSRPVIYGFDNTDYLTFTDNGNQNGRSYDLVLNEWQESRPKRKKTFNDIRSTHRDCKDGLVTTLIHNVKQYLKGEPIVPVYFLYKTDGWAPDEWKLHVRAQRNGVTSAELRTVYKLIHEFPLAIVRDLAKATFQFMKVNGKALEAIDAPWDEPNSDFKNHWSNGVVSTKPSRWQGVKSKNWLEPNSKGWQESKIKDLLKQDAVKKQGSIDFRMYTRTPWNDREHHSSLVGLVLKELQPALDGSSANNSEQANSAPEDSLHSCLSP